MTEKVTAWYRCMRCGHTWEGTGDDSQERSCPQCKSNSVRKLRRPPQ
jgi:DNA-directed RNA polymerase subunit RPC12/RpoP